MQMCIQLAGKVKRIICFGKEAEQLRNICLQNNIYATAHKTLEDAFEFCMQQAIAGDMILFSPSGASFDLFENYQARGACFKTLVLNYLAKLSC